LFIINKDIQINKIIYSKESQEFQIFSPLAGDKLFLTTKKIISGYEYVKSIDN
jgi:hypothetical protein